MAVLALDLGTHTGWALLWVDVLTSGTWDLSPGRGRAHKAPWLNLWDRLTDIGKEHEVTTIVYEDVVAHPRPARMVGGKRKPPGTNVYAAHLYGSLRWTVVGWAEMNDASAESVPVPVVKKHATGVGNANKDKVINAIRRRHSGQTVATYDQADALAVLDYWRAKER